MREDEASLSILGEVLGSFQNLRDLKLYPLAFEQWNVSEWILTKLLSPLKTNLRSITVSHLPCSFMPYIATDEISVGLHGIGVEQSRMVINSLMRMCSLADRHASVIIF